MLNDDDRAGCLWITGGRGFIGRHLGRHLAQEGHQVAGLGHGHWPEASAWGFHTWLNGSIEPDSLQTLAGLTGPPKAVFHLAGGSAVGPSLLAPAEDFRRTVESTLNLMEWVRAVSPRTRVIYVSSAAVYGAAYQGPIPEGSRTAPTSPYGFHKRMGEDLTESYARQYKLPVAIARLFSVYGPALRKQLLWDLCSRLQAGQDPLRVFGTGEERRDWLHVADAASLLTLLMDHASPEAPRINGGTGQGTSICQITEYLADQWKPRVKVVFTGEVRTGDPRCLVADPTQARSLGFHAGHDWREGIAEYVRWFRSSRREGY